MKNKILALLISLLALCTCMFTLTACGGVEFKVNFVVDGQVYSTLNTNGEEIIQMPENPTKDGYTFDGWYWDKDTWTQPFTANSLLDAPLSSDMNVYCKWKANVVHVSSVTLNKTEITLNADGVEYLTAIVSPSDATEKGVLWQSSNSSIVSVDNGVIKAVGYGTATITATSVEGNKTATCVVNVIEDKITFNTLSVNDETVYGKVSNDTTTFSFIREVVEHGNATFKVFKEITCETEIYSKLISLNIGDNTVYILQTVGKNIKLYTVTVRRRPMHEVTFIANGGSETASQSIEEDHFATIPQSPTRAGYDFTGWDYDLTTPITQPTEITAQWQVRNDTPYKVEYYLQNLEDDDYTLTQTVNKTGTTDTTATAEIKDITHFTFDDGNSSNVLSGNIDGKGTLLLKVYYTRNVYTLSINDNTAGSITNAGSYKYGTQPFSSTAQSNLGYDFGWHCGAEMLSNDLTYTFTVTQNVVAKFTPKQEMSNFNFTSTTTTCNIMGLKDNAVTEIIVPNYVTRISSSAFRYCSSLASVTVPFVGATLNGTSNTHFGYIFGASNYSYNDDYVPTSLKTVIITGGKSIGEYAFYNCSSLAEVTIPNSITSIGDYAFYGCSSLTYNEYDNAYYLGNETNKYLALIKAKNTSITSCIINENTKVIADNAFEDCDSLTSITIPNSVTRIGGGTFSYCRSLTSITIPNSVTSIGDHAFCNCDSLTSITIPNSVTSIGYDAFWGCSSLTSITIGSGVKSIGNSAFRNCSNLTSVTIPNSVKSIDSHAFEACYKLVEVYNLSSLSIGTGSTENGYVGYYAKVIHTNVNEQSILTTDSNGFITFNNNNGVKTLIGYVGGKTEITISNDIKAIYQNAFYDCDSLTSVTIPNSVTWIGRSAFYDCDSLTSVTIGSGVTSIGNYAFYSCSSLTSITIPNSVTSIGAWAFEYCSSLKSVTIGSGVTGISSYAFEYCSSLTSIKYRGSQTQWNAISKGSSWDSNTGNYTITYNYTGA